MGFMDRQGMRILLKIPIEDSELWATAKNEEEQPVWVVSESWQTLLKYASTSRVSTMA